MSDSINEQRCERNGLPASGCVASEYDCAKFGVCAASPSVVTPPPTFDAMLRDPSEQFDRNSELLPGILSYLSGQERTEEVERLLRSVEAYRNAPSNTLGAPPRTVTPPAQDEQPEFVTYGPTPLPAAPSASTDHTDEKRLALIRRAIADPGQFTPRGDNYEEPIYAWGARAVVIALDRIEASRG